MAEAAEAPITEEKPYDLFDHLMNSEDGEPNPINGSDSGQNILDWVFEEEGEKPAAEKPAEPKKEVKKEEKPADKPVEGAEAIMAKYEAGEEITEAEIKILTEAGYEVSPVETDEASEAKPEDKKEETHTTAYDDYLGQLFPDQEFSTRKDKETAIVDFIERELKIGQDLMAAFEKAPYLTNIIKDINNGVDSAQAVYRHLPFKPEEEPEPGTPEYKAYIKAQIERENAQAEQEKRREQIKANFLESGKKAQEFAARVKLTDEKKNLFFQEVNSILENVKIGKIDERFYEIVAKGKAYDADLEAAKKVREATEGRKAIQRYKIQKRGDGLPKMTSAKVKEKAPDGGDFLDKTIDTIGTRQKTDWGIRSIPKG